VPTSADTLRRWLGLLFLALAFGMLIWGQIVLRDRLHGLAFLIYWACCFLFTLAAIVTALLDVRATRKRAQNEHNELVRRTLEELERKDAGDSGSE
jgi:membrane protein implicated in regulation of membrane protease activity